ncbi:MAG TPA: VWA domain-containing protein [Blastocatellia bacterium]|nr:VWA domain-containing protein [Blastocatellia bacterium]
MFRRCNGPVLFLASCCLLSAGALAQSGRMREPSTPRVPDDKDALHLVAEEILLPIAVKGEPGKPAPAVTPSDFFVVEDGKKQQITSVMQLPANILVMLDASGEATLVKNAGVTRELGYKLIEMLGTDDRGAIISYADKVNLISDWTGDKTQLRQALEWKYRPGLKSSLYEALTFGAEELLTKANGRRILVLVTDGIDTFSKDNFVKALLAVNRVRATVYIVSQAAMLLADLKPVAYNKFSWYEMLDPARRRKIMMLRAYLAQLESFEPNLQRLAEETGGFLWSPASRDEFKSLAGEVTSEISLECLIAYVSQRKPNDNDFHSVAVSTRLPGVTVRVRRGVYAGAVDAKHTVQEPASSK